MDRRYQVAKFWYEASLRKVTRAKRSGRARISVSRQTRRFISARSWTNDACKVQIAGCGAVPEMMFSEQDFQVQGRLEIVFIEIAVVVDSDGRCIVVSARYAKSHVPHVRIRRK